MIKRDLMDPKALNHLDPKARETYDRIMGAAHDSSGATQSDPAMTTPTQADAVMPPDPVAGDLSSPSSDPLISAADPNNVLSTSPSASPISDPMLSSSMIDPMAASNQMPSEPSIPEPTPDPFTQASTPSAGITDPSATLFASDPPNPMIPTSGSTTSPSSSPSAFFNNPAPQTNEPQPDLASPQAFSTLDSQTNASDPMAPITPYNPSPGDPQAQVFTQPLPSPAEVSQANAPHETSSLLRVLYIVGAVVFFAIYTIFWVKVFNLPFLF